MAESSDLKISAQLGFAKAHHKITHKRIVDITLGHGSSQKFRILFNRPISVMAEAIDFKFGTELGFAKSNYTITPIDKSGCGRRVWRSQNFGVPL